MDNLYSLKNLLSQVLTENTEKTYEVKYWYRYGDNEKDYDTIKVKASSEEEAKNEAKKQARRGAIQSSFEIELDESIEEDTRFDFQKGGGGGKRFIPTNGIVPNKLFTALPNHFKMLDNQLLISPEAVIALTSVERGRGGAINYKELYGKLRGYFDIKKANSSSEFGPAQTSSFLSQFKQGLKGRLEAVMTGGKEFKVWNGEGSKNEKGDFIFPLAQFKAMEENYFSQYGQDELTAEEGETDADVTYNRGANHFINGAVEIAERLRQQAIYQGQLTSQDEDEFPDYESLFGGEDTENLQENEEGLRSQLHSLVGNEMRLGKRANMTGASNHVEEHEKAEKAVEDFLRKNPSMEEYRDKVEDHFTKLLFRENKEEDQPGKFGILVSSLAKYLNGVSRDEMFDENGNYNSTLKGYHDELKQYADNGTEEEQLKANFLLGFI